MYTPEDIINSISKLEVLESAANDCETVYEQNPESEQAESNFDKAYKAEWNQREKCARMIVEFSNSVIDFKTALQLIKPNYRSRLMNAINI